MCTLYSRHPSQALCWLHCVVVGTVIPPGKKLHLSPNVAMFRSRATSLRAGEAVFVVQVPDGTIPADGSSVSWNVVDENGSSVNFA